MIFKELDKIRKDLDFTKSAFADVIHITRQTYYNWEKSEIIPQDEVDRIMELLKSKFKIGGYILSNSDIQGNQPILNEPSIIYENSEVKQVKFEDFMETAYLPIEAQAGYLDAIETQETPNLNYMLIPREFEKGNYLIVEISGDSMNDGSSRAIQDGDKLLVKELQKHHWKNKLHFKQYLFVIMSRDGVVCKQVTNHDLENGIITCHSWNELYKDYSVNLDDVYKLFYVKKIVERRIKF